MKDHIDNINIAIEQFKIHTERQLIKNSKVAGIRARRSSLELGKLLKEFRKISTAYSKR